MNLDKLPETAGDTTPASMLAPEPLQGAGFGIRFLARWIDVVASYVISYITLVAFLIILSTISYAAGDRNGQTVSQFLSRQSLSEIIFSMVAYWVYHAVAEHVSGVTVGKWITGLAVVSEDGTRARLSQTLVRNGWWAYAESVNFGQPAISHMYSSPRRQRNGDIAAVRWWSSAALCRRKPPPRCSTSFLAFWQNLLLQAPFISSVI